MIIEFQSNRPDVYGECGKHPGENMTNCSQCAMEEMSEFPIVGRKWTKKELAKVKLVAKEIRKQQKKDKKKKKK